MQRIPICIAVNNNLKDYKVGYYKCQASGAVIASNLTKAPFSPFGGGVMSRKNKKFVTLNSKEIKAELKKVGHCKVCASSSYVLKKTALDLSKINNAHINCVICQTKIPVRVEGAESLIDEINNDYINNNPDVDDNIDPEAARDDVSLIECEDDMNDDDNEDDNSDNDDNDNDDNDDDDNDGDDNDGDDDDEDDDNEDDDDEDMDDDNEDDDDDDDDEDIDDDSEDNDDEDNEVNSEDDMDDEDEDEDEDEDGDDDMDDEDENEVNSMDDEDMAGDNADAEMDENGFGKNEGVMCDKYDGYMNDDDADPYHDEIKDQDMDDDTAVAVTSNTIDINVLETVGGLANKNLSLVPVNADLAIILADDVPVIKLEAAKAGDNMSLFNNPAKLVHAFNTALQANKNFDVKEFGGSSYVYSVPVQDEIQRRIKTGVEAATITLHETTASLNHDFKQCLAIAAVMINKNLDKNATNPIKAHLIRHLKTLNIRNANRVVEEALAASSEDYIKVLLTKTKELVAKPLASRNEIAKLVQSASDIEVNVDDNNNNNTNDVGALLEKGSLYVSTANFKSDSSETPANQFSVISSNVEVDNFRNLIKNR